MRKVVFAINVTADGCCDHTMFNPDDEVLEYFTQITREADYLLYGRKTYELMVPYWPDIAQNSSGQSKGDMEFAQAFTSVRHIMVFSRTLKKAQSAKTIIVSGNPREEIQKLKHERGKNILTGGVSFPSELLQLGLIDEIRIVVHPIVAGRGRRLFDDLDLQEKLQLKLVDTHIFKSGCVALRYLRQ
jgi:dihydrofolate reductase